MGKQKGIIHLLPLLLIVAVIILVVLLVSQGKIKLPGVPSLPGTQQVPKIELKSEYQNPFKKETQYVNPFETYKNPFVTAK